MQMLMPPERPLARLMVTRGCAVLARPLRMQFHGSRLPTDEGFIRQVDAAHTGGRAALIWSA